MAHLVTRRQRAVVNAVRELIKENNYSPSVRQLGDRLGLAPATVQQHLDALERKGTIARTGGAFGIEILEPDYENEVAYAGTFRAPLIGAIAAGRRSWRLKITRKRWRCRRPCAGRESTLSSGSRATA